MQRCKLIMYIKFSQILKPKVATFLTIIGKHTTLKKERMMSLV